YNCTLGQIIQWVSIASQSLVEVIAWELPNGSGTGFDPQEDWAEQLPWLSAHYQRQGVGIFAQFSALRWRGGGLEGVAEADPIQLTDLTGYETQKETLMANTQALLQGRPALHVLLYGSRGAGKSSLVKALANHYSAEGLRLIEVTPEELGALPEIFAQLRPRPQKFILFVDDLSFEDDDQQFKALKRALEGTVVARPRNVVIYATSNRRHLVREFWDERPQPKDAGEIHAWDSTQEKLSFADRFGLSLTFESANQDTYLAIVHHLSRRAGLDIALEDLDFQAKQWATRHNGRSGRSARQFVDYLLAQSGRPISPSPHL
ncbi:MAG: ATP-binding protein, partial [Cyanobacteriota bacterium]